MRIFLACRVYLLESLVLQKTLLQRKMLISYNIDDDNHNKISENVQNVWQNYKLYYESHEKLESGINSKRKNV